MLDEKDLQAIAQLMDSKMAQQKKEIISETMVLMEAYFAPNSKPSVSRSILSLKRP